MPHLLRYAAFSTRPDGGNPAGVWIGDELPAPEEMQRIAAEVGYSETIFVSPERGVERDVRYFSPEAEVTFCGHATVAAGVALGKVEGEGTYRFRTAAGTVPVAVEHRDGHWRGALTSVAPAYRAAPQERVLEALAALNWSTTDLDPYLPPALAYAGAWHLVLAVSTHERLMRLTYDFEALKVLMQQLDLTTVQLVWREHPALFHARNPFPVGGVVEDPATGAAAAALGGYLRATRQVNPPASFVIRQGEVMGRPSRLDVHVPEQGGIVVSGAAVSI